MDTSLVHWCPQARLPSSVKFQWPLDLSFMSSKRIWPTNQVTCKHCWNSQGWGSIPERACQFQILPTSVWLQVHSVCNYDVKSRYCHLTSPIHISPSAVQPIPAHAAPKSQQKGAVPINHNRKFNIVVFGVSECPKGTNRQTRQSSDLSSIATIISSLNTDVKPDSIIVIVFDLANLIQSVINPDQYLCSNYSCQSQ